MNIDYIKKHSRYSDFIFLDEKVIFNEYFKDKDYAVVQIHDINPICNNCEIPIGYCGSFKWESNDIISLDGDSYEFDMPIYGYKEFINQDNELCLDILTDQW